MSFEITPLFSTPIYYAKNENLSFDDEIIFIKQIDSIQAKTNKVSKNTRVLNFKELDQCRSLCEYHLKSFVANTFDCKQDFFITNSWTAITDPGESHHLHYHPNSIVSGVLYLNSGDQCGNINFHYENALKKAFSFNYDYNSYNIFNSSMWSYAPQTGDIFVFPSWVEHSVDVNQSNTARIILGFNAFVKGKFGDNEYAADLLI